MIELHDANGAKIGSNDNWKVDDQTGLSQESAVRATTIPPTDDHESAIVGSFAPRAYTAITAGKGGTVAWVRNQPHSANGTFPPVSNAVQTPGRYDLGHDEELGGHTLQRHVWSH
jgi:hypothetical protein